MSEVLMRWTFIAVAVYFSTHLAVFLLRLNGVEIGGVHYGK